MTPKWSNTTGKAETVIKQSPILSPSDPTNPDQLSILVQHAQNLGISEPKIEKALANHTLSQAVRLREKTLKHVDRILQNYEIRSNERLALKSGTETHLTTALMTKIVKTALKNNISGEEKVLQAGGITFLATKVKGNGLQITEYKGEHFLGQGAMGAVSRELQISRGELVALGDLCGYGGGINRKQWLLNHEKAALVPQNW